MSGGFQPGCWQPFTATSPINTALPANPPLAADNAAVVAHMAAYGWTFQGGPSGFQIDGGGSRPIYFASPSDPVLTIHCTYLYGPRSCTTPSTGINVDATQIHVPRGAQPSPNADAHMTIIQTATGQEYDLYHASINGSTLTAGTAYTENVNTSNGTGSGGDAASLALSAGLLRPSELASGQINHALVIDIPCTNATGANTGYVYPAIGGWGAHCGQLWNESPIGAPSIGQLFRLDMTDAQIATSGAPPWQQTIMTALAHYGAYAEDTNGTWQHQDINIFTQDPTSWTSLGQPNQWTTTINALGGHNGTLTSPIPIPTNKLQLINPCLPQGTCPAGSGAAAPAAAPGPVATVRRGRSGHPGSATAARRRRARSRRHRYGPNARFTRLHSRRHRIHPRPHRRRPSRRG